MTSVDAKPLVSFEGPERTISQALMVDYTDTLGFRNPIHYGGDFAKVSEFGGPIASGPFALALLDDLMLTKFPHSWLTRSQLSVAFVAPVRPDDTIKALVDLTDVQGHDGGTRLVFSIRAVSSEGNNVMAGTASIDVA